MDYDKRYRVNRSAPLVRWVVRLEDGSDYSRHFVERMAVRSQASLIARGISAEVVEQHLDPILLIYVDADAVEIASVL